MPKCPAILPDEHKVKTKGVVGPFLEGHLKLLAGVQMKHHHKQFVEFLFCFVKKLPSQLFKGPVIP